MPKAITKIILSLLILILLAIWAEIARSPANNDLRLIFLNVGQGDAALIERGDYQILVDGGPDASILSQISRYMPLADRKIEVLVLSHPHADHLAGVNQILERYEVGKIYFTGVVDTSNQYLDFLNTVKEKNIEAIVPDVNQTEQPFADARLTFLWPGKQFGKQSNENFNNTSEVLKFCYFSQCAVFLGDAQIEEQRAMFAGNQAADFQAQILKVAHHGSSNGTDKATIDKIRPQYAVISVAADNKYGHPHSAVLELLANAGVKVLRTDRDGNVVFSLSSSSIVESKR